MELDPYHQRDARRYDQQGADHRTRLTVSLLGLGGEIGDLQTSQKKGVRDGVTPSSAHETDTEAGRRRHHFRRFLPRLEGELDGLARQVGWGINPYFTDSRLTGDDVTLLHAAQQLALDVAAADQTAVDVTEIVRASGLSNLAVEADQVVSDMVQTRATAAAREAPWFPRWRHAGVLGASRCSTTHPAPGRLIDPD